MNQKLDLKPLLDKMELEGYGLLIYNLLPDKVSYTFKGKGYTVLKDSVEHRIENSITFIKHEHQTNTADNTACR